MVLTPGASALLIVDLVPNDAASGSRWAYRKRRKDALDQVEEVILDHGGERVERQDDCLLALFPSLPATVQAAADCLRRRGDQDVPLRLYLHFASLEVVRREPLERQPSLAALLETNADVEGAYASRQFLAALSPEIRQQLEGILCAAEPPSAPQVAELARLLGKDVKPTAPPTPAGQMPQYLESTVPPEKRNAGVSEPANLTGLLDTISREALAPAGGEELHVTHRGNDYVIDCDRTSLRIGRGLENDIVINSRYVSRNHARIEFLSGRFEFVNLSPNGSCIQPKTENELVCTERFRLLGAGAIRLAPSFDEDDLDLIRYAST